MQSLSTALLLCGNTPEHLVVSSVRRTFVTILKKVLPSFETLSVFIGVRAHPFPRFVLRWRQGIWARFAKRLFASTRAGV